MEKIYESRFMKGLQNFGIKLSNSKAGSAENFVYSPNAI